MPPLVLSHLRAAKHSPITFLYRVKRNPLHKSLTYGLRYTLCTISITSDEEFYKSILNEFLFSIDVQQSNLISLNMFSPSQNDCGDYSCKNQRCCSDKQPLKGVKKDSGNCGFRIAVIPFFISFILFFLPPAAPHLHLPQPPLPLSCSESRNIPSCRAKY